MTEYRRSLPLFDPADRPVHLAPTARSRNTDPATSLDAAVMVEETGIGDTQRAACLHVVRDRPGLTAAEIAQRAGLERHAASRRLPELREACLVDSRDPRVCQVQGTRAMTWWPVHLHHRGTEDTETHGTGWSRE